MENKIEIIKGETYRHFQLGWEITFIGHHYSIDKEGIIEIKLRRGDEKRTIIWHLPKKIT